MTKMKKNIWKIAFAIAALLMAVNVDRMDAKAAANGTSFDDAIAVEFGQEYQKSYARKVKNNNGFSVNTEYYDGVYYRFSLSSSGQVNLTASSTLSSANGSGAVVEDVHLYNSQKQVIISFDINEFGIMYNMYLVAGDYYLCFCGCYDRVETYTHEFTMKYTDAKETIKESQSKNNNSIAKADDISLGKSYTGQLGQNDRLDCYRFELPSSGRVTFDTSIQCRGFYQTLYDESGSEINSMYGTNTTGSYTLSPSYDLTKGVYYVSMSAQDEKYYGTYILETKFESANESFEETGTGTNNSINTADEIKQDIEYTGQIATNDRTDYYKITMPAKGTLDVNGTSNSLDQVYVSLYSAGGNSLVSYISKINTAGINNFSLTRECEAGDYYICIAKNNQNTGNYTLTAKITIPVSAVVLDKTALDLHEGDSADLTATVTPELATDRSLIWSSSNADVAAVDENGVVTAKLAGTAIITALAADGSEKSASCTVNVAANEQIVYRLYNNANYEHLYTTDANEVKVLVTTCGWEYEGSAWIAPTSGFPVYRLNNAGLQNHLYTTDENEVRVLTTQYGWELDNDGKPLFYSGGTQNIYRLYKEDLNGMHLLSTDLNEYNILGSPAQGWDQEGVKLNCLAIGDNQYPFPD